MFAFRKRSKSKKAMLAVAAGAAVLLGGAGTAQAVLTQPTASGSERLYMATETNAWTLPAASSGAWQNVPNMARTITVASGTSRQLVASYNAESLCTGSGYCSVRIVYVNSAGAAVELHPQSGTDFAFDTDGDSWSSHSIKRTTRVTAGTYRVQVQAARVGGTSTTVPALRLDEHYFDVETRF